MNGRLMFTFRAGLGMVLTLGAAGVLADEVHRDQLDQANHVLDARQVDQAPPLDPGASAWQQTAAWEALLHPQVSVPPRLDGHAARPVEVRALAGDDRLAIRLHWADPSADTRHAGQTNRFADKVAIQFPVDAEAASGLPYIGMGEPERPVRIWFWRGEEGVEALRAEGFGSLAPDREMAGEVEVDATHDNDAWTIVFRGPLPEQVNPMPVAVALWEGAAGQRAGEKRLSKWHLLHVEGVDSAPKRYAALAGQARVSGNPARGERLAREHGCQSCHRLPNGPEAEIGPDLRLAGAQHWPGYLRRVIEDPASFVLPHEAYRDGEGDTLMPREALSQEELEDLVSYLQTLRGNDDNALIPDE